MKYILHALTLFIAAPLYAQNADAPCSALTQPVSERLRQQSVSYHDTLEKKARELCGTPEKANRFYRQGAVQLSEFLSKTAFTLNDACQKQLNDTPLYFLTTVPNLNNIFTLEEGYNLCAATADKKASQKAKNVKVSNAKTSNTEERYAKDKTTLDRMSSMGAHFTPELIEYKNTIDAAKGASN